MKFRLGTVLAKLAALVFAAACQPKDTRPGLWLSGEPTDRPAESWRFTEGVEEIFIETRTWYGLRHSTTIWCVELAGRLYVGSYDADVKYWERNIARSPEARLRIDGKIYEVELTLITDANQTAALDAAYNRKYDMEEVFGDDLPVWWFYHAVQRDS